MILEYMQYLLKALREVKSSGEKVYIVGGAIRDEILDKPVHDYDFAVKRNPKKIARNLANYLKTGFYILDDFRQTARVVYKKNSGETLTLDFAKINGSSIEEDLNSRDFTFNAIAVDIDHPDILIDPLGGSQALTEHNLRPCSLNTFSNDPIRILRAIRFSLLFQMKIKTSVWKSMKTNAVLLGRVSKERKRDEFMHILSLDHVYKAIQMLDELGIIDQLYPQISFMKETNKLDSSRVTLWEHSLRRLRHLDRIRGWIKSPLSDRSKWNSLAEIFLANNKELLPRLRNYLSESFVADRTRECLLELAVLVFSNGNENVKTIAENSTLSNQEQDFIIRLTQSSLSMSKKADLSFPVNKRNIYRFYRSVGDSGIGIILLLLAELMTRFGKVIPIRIWEKKVKQASKLFKAWWVEYHGILKIQPLLNGDEIIKGLSLSEGPEIGELLEVLKEEQAIGAIRTREQALLFLCHTIQTGKMNIKGTE